MEDAGMVKCYEATVELAIACVSLKVEKMFEAGEPYNSLQIVELIETFCPEVPSDRWRAISKGVIEKLEFWEVIEPNGTIIQSSE